MSEKLFCLDNRYSTTRLLSKLRPKIENLFHNPQRIEGGLRNRNLFKYTYEIENVFTKHEKWYACDWKGNRLFEVEPPKNFDKSILKYLRNNSTIKLPLVSIITVVLNGEKYIEQTIKSVLNQTYSNIEYIIIDGGSKDATLDIIKKYENYIDYWISESDKGIYDAMNKGISIAYGISINLLNTGDVFGEDYILKIAKFIDYDKVIYTNFILKHTDHFFRLIHTNDSFERGMSLSHQATFIPKCIYERFGFYSLNYKLASDYEFFLRLKKNKVSFKKVEIDDIYILSEGITRKKLSLSNREAMKIYKNYYSVFSLKYLNFVLFCYKNLLLNNIRHYLIAVLGRDTFYKIRSKIRITI